MFLWFLFFSRNYLFFIDTDRPMFFLYTFYIFYFLFVYFRFLYQLDFFYFVTAPLNRVTWIHGAIKMLSLLLLLLLLLADLTTLGPGTWSLCPFSLTLNRLTLVFELPRPVCRLFRETRWDIYFRHWHSNLRKPVGAMGDNIFRTLWFYFIWRPPNNYMASAK